MSLQVVYDGSEDENGSSDSCPEYDYSFMHVIKSRPGRPLKVTTVHRTVIGAESLIPLPPGLLKITYTIEIALNHGNQ